MEDSKGQLLTIARVCRFLAMCDFVLGIMCAMNGKSMFVGFMLLAGGMWGYGAYIQSKADTLQGE
mgnify:CR=1 FL=1